MKKLIARHVIQHRNWDDRDRSSDKTETARRERPVIGEHSKWLYSRFWPAAARFESRYARLGASLARNASR